MTDLLREIDEELQRERMAALWHKHKRAVIVAALLLVLGTASVSAWRDHALNEQYRRSAALFALGSRPEQSDKALAEALTAFAKDKAGTGHAIPAWFAAAAAHRRAKDYAAAIAILDRLALDQTLSLPLRRYAELLAAQAQFDLGVNDALRAKLEVLAADGQPWRYSARALLGLYHARQGGAIKAGAIYRALTEDVNAPPVLREQARDLARYYALQP